MAFMSNHTYTKHLHRACEGSGISPYVQAIKLAYHSFVVASRRHRVGPVRDKDFITHWVACRLSFMSLSVLFVPRPMGAMWKGSGASYVCSGFVLRLRDLSLGNRWFLE